MSERYSNWGRTRTGAGARMAVEAPCADEPASLRSAGGSLPYGNGRSYGDSCLNDAGFLVDMRRRDRVLFFDPATGVMEVESGVLLSRITRLAAPHGWFLPVTPGTQFVTVGGALANDVHGKNHHRRGSFGCWVDEFTLVRSDRSPMRCSRESNVRFFEATIGGLGMTGTVTRVRLRLLRVPSLTIRQVTHRLSGLDDYFARAPEADVRHEYAVAWIDSLATGRAFGRGRLICGDHAERGDREGRARAPILTVPFTPPVSPLVGPGLRLFNEAYARATPADRQVRDVAFDGFFYPLDRIGRWNRLYGPAGLHQHQSVLPPGDARRVVEELLACARLHRQGSFLTVLKRFGDVPSPGLMSFARPGVTLTLDFPNRGERTLRLLADLDRITVEAGGAVNPYKDARMSPETFAAGFPRWSRLEALRDPATMSDFWRRTAMRLAAPTAIRPAEAA